MEARNLAIGSELSKAPEFGPGGAPPPIVTNWQAKRWELFEVEPSETSGLGDLVASALIAVLSERDPGIDTAIEGLLRAGDLLDRESSAAVFTAVPLPVTAELSHWRDGRPTRIGIQGPDGVLGEANASVLKRVTHSQRWRRNDPIMQLAPGSSLAVTLSDTTGLSIEQSKMLATSLGMSLALGSDKVGVKGGLNSSLQQQLGVKVDFTTQKQEANTVTITNSSDQSRLYALWHVDYRISVDSLSASLSESHITGQTTVVYDTIESFWSTDWVAEFTVTSDPHITSITVDLNAQL